MEIINQLVIINNQLYTQLCNQWSLYFEWSFLLNEPLTQSIPGRSKGSVLIMSFS